MLIFVFSLSSLALVVSDKVRLSGTVFGKLTLLVPFR